MDAQRVLDSQRDGTASSGSVERLVRPSGPRLRCIEKWSNGFYGTYRGHTVTIERDYRDDPWTFLVVGPDGIRCADGVMRERTTLREAIIYAVTGAQLWPNTEVSHD